MSTINNPAKKSLSSVFDKNVYHVPKYQRAYSWEENNWIELWSDIKNYIFSEDKEHFLGAIIHYHNPSIKSAQYSHYDVIDGQQRLTTLTILVRVIYEKLKESNEQVYSRFADEVYNKYISDTKHDCNFLSLSKKDDYFFKDYIQKVFPTRTKQGKLISNKNIRKCYEFFQKSITDFIAGESEPYEKLWELKKRLEANLIFVVIDVNTDVDAYMIFESINSKRQGLTISDLLKNYIFMAADHYERDYPDSKKLLNAESTWEAMENTLDKVEVNQYIRHYWVSRYEKVFEKELYQKIKQKLGTTPGSILSFYDEVTSEAELYASIVNANVPSLSLEGQQSLEQLKSLRNRQYYPLILSALATKQDPLQISDLIRKITSVAVRRAIIGRNPNELEVYFADSAINLRNGKSTITTVSSDLMQKFLISDDDIRGELSVMNFSDQEYLAKFLLREIENASHFTDEKKLIAVTLEHVLPQNPEQITDWDLGDKQLEDVVWNIGNLTLIHQKLNNKMSNKAFSEKRKWLEKSQLKTTSAIAQSDKWGKDEILKRNETISDFVVSKWPN